MTTWMALRKESRAFILETNKKKNINSLSLQLLIVFRCKIHICVQTKAGREFERAEYFLPEEGCFGLSPLLFPHAS